MKSFLTYPWAANKTFIAFMKLCIDADSFQAQCLETNIGRRGERYMYRYSVFVFARVCVGESERERESRLQCWEGLEVCGLNTTKAVALLWIKYAGRGPLCINTNSQQMKNWHRADPCWDPYLSWPLLIRQEQAEQMNINTVTQGRTRGSGEEKKKVIPQSSKMSLMRRTEI